MTEGVLHLVPTCRPLSELRRGLRPCSDHHKIRPLASCTRLEKGRAVLVDESLDRQRGPATNLKDVIVGAGEDAVCMIVRANAERRSLAARPGLPDRGTSRRPSSARAAVAR